MTEPAPNPDQPHGGTLETSLPAALWSIARAIEFTKRSLKELGCPPSAQTSLVVIVDEIASNIAKFAYGESGGDVTIRISAKPDECDIEIAFIDEGVAFNPLEAHAADAASIVENRRMGGQGIRIARKLADEMEYERRDGKNFLRIRKRVGRWPG